MQLFGTLTITMPLSLLTSKKMFTVIKGEYIFSESVMTVWTSDSSVNS